MAKSVMPSTRHAATAFNFKSWIRKAVAEAIFVLKYLKEICLQYARKSDVVGLVFNG
jgi:hypothetical protein